MNQQKRDYPMFCSWNTNNPPSLNFEIFLLILASAGGSNPAGPYINLFPNPDGVITDQGE